MGIGKVQIPELRSTFESTFESKFDGFGVPCDRCGAENAGNRISGDIPPDISGTYCAACHADVVDEVGAYVRRFIKEVKAQVVIATDQ